MSSSQGRAVHTANCIYYLGAPSSDPRSEETHWCGASQGICEPPAQGQRIVQGLHAPGRPMHIPCMHTMQAGNVAQSTCHSSHAWPCVSSMAPACLCHSGRILSCLAAQVAQLCPGKALGYSARPRSCVVMHIHTTFHSACTWNLNSCAPAGRAPLRLKHR